MCCLRALGNIKAGAVSKYNLQSAARGVVLRLAKVFVLIFLIVSVAVSARSQPNQMTRAKQSGQPNSAVTQKTDGFRDHNAPVGAEGEGDVPVLIKHLPPPEEP